MPELSRSQILVYGAVGVALLLLGARWIRAADQQAPAASGGVSFAADSAQAAGGDGRDVVVHVAGAVRRPGVYTMPAGSRVADAVKRAGNMTRDGSQDAINLAARLSDGQQIVVPSVRAGASAATAADGPISLGSATVEQLDTIEGIGPITAQNIIAFRDEQIGRAHV